MNDWKIIIVSAVIATSSTCAIADDFAPELVDLATELKQEGYANFSVKTSFFGGKALIGNKGSERITINLSRDFSIKNIDVRIDQNGDGKFSIAEKFTKEDKQKVEALLGKVEGRVEGKFQKRPEEKKAKHLALAVSEGKLSQEEAVSIEADRQSIKEIINKAKYGTLSKEDA